MSKILLRFVAALTAVFVLAAWQGQRQILSTNKLACNSIQDISDILSMSGKGDEAMPLLMAKLRQGDCRQWFAGTAVAIERREVRTPPATGQPTGILCLTRIDAEDGRCFWTLPDGVQSR